MEGTVHRKQRRRSAPGGGALAGDLLHAASLHMSEPRPFPSPLRRLRIMWPRTSLVDGGKYVLHVLHHLRLEGLQVVVRPHHKELGTGWPGGGAMTSILLFKAGPLEHELCTVLPGPLQVYRRTTMDVVLFPPEIPEPEDTAWHPASPACQPPQSPGCGLPA